MSRMIIWIVQGFDKIHDDGKIDNVVTFEVYAKTEEEAIKRAEQLIKKDHYRIQSVIEK